MHDHREAACEKCPVENCPTGGATPADAPRGWRLVLTSIGFFLAPLLLALLGSACLAETGTGQFVGGVAGLALGLAGAAVVSRLLRDATSREQLN